MALLRTSYYLLLLTTAISAVVSSETESRIHIDSDGGYSGIVIKIDKDVPVEKCPEILQNLKVGMELKFLSNTSFNTCSL